MPPTPRTDFSKLVSARKLSGYVVAETSLRIGRGRALDAGAASDLPVMKDVHGRPFIPGSSLRGVLRSYTESRVRGLNRPDIWSCNIVDGEPCVSNDTKVTAAGKSVALSELPTEQQADAVLKCLCDVCNLFGSPRFGSRLRFSDMPVVVAEWDELMLQVRDGVAIDRETGTAKPGAKFDFEVVPAGTRFRLHIAADNCEEWQLGLLFSTLDAFNDGFGRLGGFSSRGPGSVGIKLDECTEVTPQTIAAPAKVSYPDLSKRCRDALAEHLNGGGR